MGSGRGPGDVRRPGGRRTGRFHAQAGGSYEYLKQIYGPKGLGRMVSFLFIWQLTFSAPLSIASGCIGLAAYAGYLWPNLRMVLLQRNLHVALPLLGRLEAIS